MLSAALVAAADEVSIGDEVEVGRSAEEGELTGSETDEVVPGELDVGAGEVDSGAALVGDGLDAVDEQDDLQESAFRAKRSRRGRFRIVRDKGERATILID